MGATAVAELAEMMDKMTAVLSGHKERALKWVCWKGSYQVLMMAGYLVKDRISLRKNIRPTTERY